MTRHLLAAALRLLACCHLLLVIASCSKPPTLHHQESYVFGTRVEVLVYGEREANARSAAAAVLREFDRLHRMLHAWQPSELTALNAAIARGEPATVPLELADLLRHAQSIAAKGDQLFNPAIGRLIALWGFQSDDFKPQIPPQPAIDALLRSAPDMRDIEIDGVRITSRNPQVALDLGGYAKGYALDRAAAILRSRGIANALINIGGNVMALGAKGGQPWRVGIQHPRQPGALATLQLHDGEAIGTSGDYQRYFELNGQRYCHLLDPRSGAPVTHTQSLTVLVSPRTQAGMLSDAASKPLFIAGREDWRRLAKQMAIADVLRVGADGRLQVTRSFATRLKFEPGVPVPEIIE